MKLKKFACMTVLFACLGSVLAFSSACDKEETPPPANERHDHVLTHVEAKSATCKEEGNIEYWYCESCAQSFTDEGASTLAESTVVAKSTEHTYGEWEDIQAVTCQAAGLNKRTCTTCNKEEEQTVAPAGQHVYGADDVCTLCPVVKPSQGLAFALSEDESYYILTGLGECEDTKLIVPDYHEGKPVRVVKEKAFNRNETITELVLYDTMETIETYAFGYTKLTKVTMGNGVKEIASSAFSSCANLTTVSWSKNLERVGGYSFDYCGFVDIVLPDFNKSVTFGNYVFRCCRELKSVTLGKGIKSFGIFTFEECTKLETTITTDLAAFCGIDFDLSGGYTSSPIARSTNLYVNDELVTKLVIPEGVTRIGNGTFGYLEGVDEVVIPDTVQEIGTHAFYCSKIKKVTLPSNLKRLEEAVLGQCRSLTEVVIPVSIEYIGKKAFYNTQSMQTLVYAGTVAQWNAIEKAENWDYNTHYTAIQCSDGKAWEATPAE